MNYNDIFSEIIKQQFAHQTKGDADWLEKDHDFNRAIRNEAFEGIGHVGSTSTTLWWRKDACNLTELTTEVIDCFIFSICKATRSICNSNSVDPLDQLAVMTTAAWYCEEDSAIDARLILPALPENYTDEDKDSIIHALEHIMLSSIDNNPMRSTSAIFRLFIMLQLSPRDIYNGYVGKLALNAFRRDNGYKEGTYIKMWYGEEDNVHMNEFTSALETSGSIDEDLITITTHLAGIYPGSK